MKNEMIVKRELSEKVRKSEILIENENDDDVVDFCTLCKY